MDYLLWSLPVVAVVLVIASGRASSALAGLCGLIAAVSVSLVSAPARFGPLEAVLGAARGAWLALLVGAVIVAGVFFREVTSGAPPAGDPPPAAPPLRRRQLYDACFLFGPFAEAATGFGVGQVTTAPILKRIGLAPLFAVLFGLFSQIMVPWGAMANGTIVGAQLSGLAPAQLGVHSALLTVPLLFAWLALFWRMAAAAGVPATPVDLAAEAACTAAAGALLVACNAVFGPEVAALSALGPLIVARFLLGGDRGRDAWRSALRVALPYTALIVGLAATRAIPPLYRMLGEAAAVRPFADGATWFPLLHPSSWLLLVGVATALATGRAALLPRSLGRAWVTAGKPVVTIVLFLAMAQVMVASGIAGGLVKGLTASLGAGAALATPLFAGLFGFLTSSSSATNGLLMPAQVPLARALDVSLPWLAAIQSVAAAALTMLSPARLTMGCALAGRPDLERHVYAGAWPLGAVPLLILLAAAALLLA